MPTWDVGRGTTKESYDAGRTGDHRTRGRQDQMGSGYWDRPANRQVLQDQQARIKKMQRDRTGIFASGRATQPKQGFLSGIGQKFKDWAGNMRGGINPLTHEYYTQDEYKDNVQARRDRATIDRLRRTRDEGKYANDPRGWQASDLSGRLEGLEKQFGIDKPVDARGLFEQEQRGIKTTNAAQDLGAPFGMEKENMLREMINNSYDTNVTSLPVDDDVMTRFSFADMGIQPNAANDFNTQMAKVYDKNALTDAGAEWAGYGFGANDELEAMEKYYNAAMKKPMHYTDPNQIRNYIQDHSGIGQSYSGIDMNLVPTDFLVNEQDFINQQSPYNLFGKSQGGRIGYNEGGRVGILGAF